MGIQRIFIPRDSAAIAVGADAVARAVAHEAEARGLQVEIVRNGSRGLLWLETFVEVETPAGRYAYGPVETDDVASLFDAGWLQGGAHRLAHGLTEDIPYLKHQERLTFARTGITDPLSLTDYQEHGGLEGLRQALAMTPEAIVEQITASGLRGRGGAAFPTGVKWKTVLAAGGDQKYIVCNADEGDSGTFSDRMLMEGDPYTLIEGMAIAGLAVQATYGYIYVRSEYPYAIATLQAAIASARKRGLVRAKPPLPAIKGLFGRPTVVNNVISLASVPIIMARGAAFYRDYGVGRSTGTLAFQLAGNIKQGGLVEKAFGVTLRELLYDFGGGSASGRPLRAVQVGGPLGAYLPESQWDVPLDYEAYMAISAMIGHGGLVAFDDSVDMAKMAGYAMEFCAVESCGKCTPCRIGAVRGTEVIHNIRNNQQREQQVMLLRDLCDTMLAGSLCALGGMTPYPVLSALEHFPEDFGLPATQPANAPVA